MARRVGETLLLLTFGVPVLGVRMGAIYAIPAMRLTKQRDPWLTVLLGCRLAMTVFGSGSLAGGQASALAWVFSVSVVLLLVARKAYGGLGHRLERFGVVHAFTWVATGLASVASRVSASHLRP